MIWGIGVGRCGTSSLAAEMGGLHEPAPDLAADPEMWLEYDVMTSRLEERLEARTALDTPIIVDWRQTYCLPLIEARDSDAEFIWVYREPADNITSWNVVHGLLGWDYRRWFQVQERKLLDGLPPWLQIQTAKYITTHALIMYHFKNTTRPWRSMNVTELALHLNENKKESLLKQRDKDRTEWSDIITEITATIWKKTLAFPKSSTG